MQGKTISLVYCVSGGHSASYPLATKGSSTDVKQLEHEIDNTA